MTLQPLAHDFAWRSPLSARHPRDVSIEEQVAELHEEFAHRQRFYPRQVEQQKMKPEAAERGVSVWQALIADHEAVADPDTRFDWDAKVRALRAELAIRRAAWPKWVASPTNPLTAAVAARRIEALDAVHWRYWFGLDCFTAPAGDPDGYLRLAWVATIEARTAPDAMPWLAAAAILRAAHAHAIDRGPGWRHTAAAWIPAADLATCAQAAAVRLDQAHADCAAGQLEEPWFGHLARLADWLTRTNANRAGTARSLRQVAA